MQPWTIKQLNDAMRADLEKCHTAHERMICEAVNGQHICEMANTWAKTRKLTPMEVAIASKYGYKPQQ